MICINLENELRGTHDVLGRDGTPNYNDLQNELRRGYDVLGEQAECQNYYDIIEWSKIGLINEKEKDSLMKFNRVLCSLLY